MRRFFVIAAAMGLLLSGCGGAADTGAYETMAVPQTTAAAMTEAVTEAAAPQWEDAVRITLDGSRFDCEVPEGRTAGFSAMDVELEEDGGEPVPEKTVLTIDQPGDYVLSGWSDSAQVVVDLGERAKDDPKAVVTLVLDGLDIACANEPAILFKNVYECGDPELVGENVDTSAAGANLYLADGSENIVTCAYETQSEYETAVWSEMSMNVGGSGGLNINSGAEGLGTALHLTVDGGQINIVSGNDGINTNYDGASVTTINGGRLNITVDGRTGEGDGIDSNGYLVINGGAVVAAACESSDDSGLDADLGIFLNGGTVIATGNMLDPISGGAGNYAVLRFSEKQPSGSTYTLNNSEGKPVLSTTPVNGFTCLILAGEGLAAGDYTLWRGQTQLQGTPGQENRMDGMMPGGAQPPEMPEGQQPPEKPEGMERPEEMTPPERPQEMAPPEGAEPMPGETFPEGMEMPPEEMELPDRDDRFQQFISEPSRIFTIEAGGNHFSYVTDVTEG